MAEEDRSQGKGKAWLEYQNFRLWLPFSQHTKTLSKNKKPSFAKHPARAHNTHELWVFGSHERDWYRGVYTGNPSAYICPKIQCLWKSGVYYRYEFRPESGQNTQKL